MNLFRFQSVRSIARHLGDGSMSVPEATTGQQATQSAGAVNAVAIVGMAGRFPGAKNVDEFWRNLRDGTESITFFTGRGTARQWHQPKLIE